MHMNDARGGYTAALGQHDDIDTSDETIRRANMSVAKCIYHLLQQSYPGHPWQVEVGHEENYGLINVRLGGLSNWSATVHLTEVNSWPALKWWVAKSNRGPGSLLERFNLPRAGFSAADWNNALRKWKPIFNMNTRLPDSI